MQGYDIYQQFQNFWLDKFQVLRSLAEIPTTNLGKEFTARSQQIEFLLNPAILGDPALHEKLR